MTKDEMLKEYGKSGYGFAQQHIKEAMQNGEDCIYMGDKNFRNHNTSWLMTYDDAEKLRTDGFEVERFGYDEWKISW